MLTFEPIGTRGSADEVASSLQHKVVICNPDALVRDCFSCALSDAGYRVFAVSSVAEWLAAAPTAEDLEVQPIVILCIGSKQITDSQVQQDIGSILTHETEPLLIIAGDQKDAHHVEEALKAGAKGYFSLDTSLNVALAALNLVHAGGVYLPPSVLTAQAATDIEPDGFETMVENNLLTPRQAAVVAALSKGKSNKIIAYELELCESTVKVHVRNIMKKLGARNRTEVAFITRKLFQPDDTLKSGD